MRDGKWEGKKKDGKGMRRVMRNEGRVNSKDKLMGEKRAPGRKKENSKNTRWSKAKKTFSPSKTLTKLGSCVTHERGRVRGNGRGKITAQI